MSAKMLCCGKSSSLPIFQEQTENGVNGEFLALFSKRRIFRGFADSLEILFSRETVSSLY